MEALKQGPHRPLISPCKKVKVKSRCSCFPYRITTCFPFLSRPLHFAPTFTSPPPFQSALHPLFDMLINMASVPMKTFTTVTLAVFASHFPGFTSAAALGNLGDPIRSVTGPMHATALSGPQCCFADNCLTWALDDSGRILHGTCYDKRDQRGHWPEVSSSLDLSNCVGNFNGVLLPASA